MPKDPLALINAIKGLAEAKIGDDKVISHLEKICKDNNIKLNAVDGEGKNALIHAVIQSQDIVVKWLLKQNKNAKETNQFKIHKLDKSNKAAIFYAVGFADDPRLADEKKSEGNTEQTSPQIYQTPLLVVKQRRIIDYLVTYSKTTYEELFCIKGAVPGHKYIHQKYVDINFYKWDAYGPTALLAEAARAKNINLLLSPIIKTDKTGNVEKNTTNLIITFMLNCETAIICKDLLPTIVSSAVSNHELWRSCFTTWNDVGAICTIGRDLLDRNYLAVYPDCIRIFNDNFLAHFFRQDRREDYLENNTKFDGVHNPDKFTKDGKYQKIYTAFYSTIVIELLHNRKISIKEDNTFELAGQTINLAELFLPLDSYSTCIKALGSTVKDRKSEIDEKLRQKVFGELKKTFSQFFCDPNFKVAGDIGCLAHAIRIGNDFAFEWLILNPLNHFTSDNLIEALNEAIKPADLDIHYPKLKEIEEEEAPISAPEIIDWKLKVRRNMIDTLMGKIKKLELNNDICGSLNNNLHFVTQYKSVIELTPKVARMIALKQLLDSINLHPMFLSFWTELCATLINSSEWYSQKSTPEVYYEGLKYLDKLDQFKFMLTNQERIDFLNKAYLNNMPPEKVEAIFLELLVEPTINKKDKKLLALHSVSAEEMANRVFPHAARFYPLDHIKFLLKQYPQVEYKLDIEVGLPKYELPVIKRNDEARIRYFITALHAVNNLKLPYELTDDIKKKLSFLDLQDHADFSLFVTNEMVKDSVPNWLATIADEKIQKGGVAPPSYMGDVVEIEAKESKASSLSKHNKINEPPEYPQKPSAPMPPAPPSAPPQEFQVNSEQTPGHEPLATPQKQIFASSREQTPRHKPSAIPQEPNFTSSSEQTPHHDPSAPPQEPNYASRSSVTDASSVDENEIHTPELSQNTHAEHTHERSVTLSFSSDSQSFIANTPEIPNEPLVYLDGNALTSTQVDNSVSTTPPRKHSSPQISAFNLFSNDISSLSSSFTQQSMSLPDVKVEMKASLPPIALEESFALLSMLRIFNYDPPLKYKNALHATNEIIRQLYGDQTAHALAEIIPQAPSKTKNNSDPYSFFNPEYHNGTIENCHKALSSIAIFPPDLAEKIKQSTVIKLIEVLYGIGPSAQFELLINEMNKKADNKMKFNK